MQFALHGTSDGSWETSGFRHSVVGGLRSSDMLRCVSWYAEDQITAYNISCVITHPFVPGTLIWAALVLEKGEIGCPETSENSYQPTSPSVPEEWKSQNVPSLNIPIKNAIKKKLWSEYQTRTVCGGKAELC
jgi:hypothetical protein